MSKCDNELCKYNDEGCIFFAQGSGNPEDMPCAEALITKKRVLKLLEDRFDIFPFTQDIISAIECMEADAVIDPNGIGRQQAIREMREVLKPNITRFIRAKMALEELKPVAIRLETEHKIIHCKDCKYFKQVFAPNDNDGLCRHWHSKCDARTSREGYCSHAERKQE